MTHAQTRTYRTANNILLLRCADAKSKDRSCALNYKQINSSISSSVDWLYVGTLGYSWTQTSTRWS